MANDLVVPIDLLADLASSLMLLMEEFHNAGDIVKGLAHQIGAEEVIDALDEFADNWDKHREELLKHMSGVYDMASKGREAFINADDDLAKDISQALQQEGHS